MSWLLQASGHVAAGDDSPAAEESLAEDFAAFARDHNITAWSFEGTHVRGGEHTGVQQKPAEPAVHRAGEYPGST